MMEMSSKEKTKLVTDKAFSLIKLIHNPPIGAKEFSGGWCPERCDAVMFCSSSCYMIETKVSRSDFLADFKKPHRQDGRGVGNFRYYACPTGLIKPEELPKKWGLIYVDIENPKSRASMPVGYGGTVWNTKKDTKHPQHGWTVRGYDSYGSKERDAFRFEHSDYERNFLFALATRYKQQKFMENIA